VEGGGGGLTVSGVSRNRGGFVKCVAIQKRLGIPALHHTGISLSRTPVSKPDIFAVPLLILTGIERLTSRRVPDEARQDFFVVSLRDSIGSPASKSVITVQNTRAGLVWSASVCSHPETATITRYSQALFQ
jgi:hypothetical protein